MPEMIVDFLAQTVDVHIDDVAARLGTAQPRRQP